MKDSEKNNLKGEGDDTFGDNLGTCKKYIVYVLLFFFLIESLFMELYQVRSAVIEFGAPSEMTWIIIIVAVIFRLLAFCFKKIIIYTILRHLREFLISSPDLIRFLKNLIQKFK